MLQSRTVNDDKTTDAISEHDHEGVVVYNNGPTNVTVTLDALNKPMRCHILILGTGTVTFQAAPTAYLQGQLSSYLNNLQPDVIYELTLPTNPAGNNARWYFK